MTKDYLTLFWLSLVSVVFFATVLTVLIVFVKRIITSKKYSLMFLAVLSLLMLVWSGRIFTFCCKDYTYYASKTYIEREATVIRFTYVKWDDDGTGELMQSKPEFFIAETGEYIVLHAKEVEVGKNYTIRYYPNTKICDVVEEVSGTP